MGLKLRTIGDFPLLPHYEFYYLINSQVVYLIRSLVISCQVDVFVRVVPFQQAWAGVLKVTRVSVYPKEA